MCVQTWCSRSTGVPCVVAGFDDGSVAMWECRQPASELTSLKLFSEPGLESCMQAHGWLAGILVIIIAVCSDVHRV